jgi:hypothetical protein
MFLLSLPLLQVVAACVFQWVKAPLPATTTSQSNPWAAQLPNPSEITPHAHWQRNMHWQHNAPPTLSGCFVSKRYVQFVLFLTIRLPGTCVHGLALYAMPDICSSNPTVRCTECTRRNLGTKVYRKSGGASGVSFNRDPRNYQQGHTGQCVLSWLHRSVRFELAARVSEL